MTTTQLEKPVAARAVKTVKNPRVKSGFHPRTCAIAGVGAYVPERVLTNADL